MPFLLVYRLKAKAYLLKFPFLLAWVRSDISSILLDKICEIVSRPFVFWWSFVVGSHFIGNLMLDGFCLNFSEGKEFFVFSFRNFQVRIYCSDLFITLLVYLSFDLLSSLRIIFISFII